MDFLYFGAPLPGGCETVGDFAVTRNLGSKNGEIYMNSQKFSYYVMYKRIWGCYNNRKP